MRRLKKILKYLALTVTALVALALIANAFLVWQSGRRLEERLSQLRAAGEPLSLAELGAAPIPLGKNAADVLQNIKPELQALIKEINPVLAKATADNPRPDPIPDEDRTVLEAAFANHPKVLPALAEAADCPVYHSQLNYQVSAPQFLEELSPRVLKLREAANVLDTQERMQLQRKDYDGAMRTCIVCLRLSRVCDGEPLMISHLVTLATRAMGIRMANETLRAGPVAPDLHKELESELAKHDNTDGLVRSLKTERSYSLQALDDLGAGWISRAYINYEKCYYLDAIAAQIEEANSSFAQLKESEANAKHAPSIRHALVDLWIPAAFKVREAAFRTRCLVRSLRVLNALTAKKHAEPPANLTDLSLPTDAITDPYTDRPLIVKKSDGQWLIYGLGPNLQDDGGKVDKNEDVGLGPIKRSDK